MHVPCHHGQVRRQDEKNDKKEYSSNRMNCRISTSVYGSDCCQEAPHWYLGKWKQDWMYVYWIGYSPFLALEPLVHGEVDEVNEASWGQHDKSEEDILRIMASGIGYSCMRIWFLFFIMYSHVVTKDANEYQRRYEKIEKIDDLQSTKDMFSWGLLQRKLFFIMITMKHHVIKVKIIRT